jgi:hypothetical protein
MRTRINHRQEMAPDLTLVHRGRDLSAVQREPGPMIGQLPARDAEFNGAL